MRAIRVKVKQIGLRSKPESDNAWCRLPFVGKDHCKRTSSWDVPLTGGYFGGIEVGEVVARMFLKYLRDERENPMRMGSSHLQNMIFDLYGKSFANAQEEDALRGQRVGFVSELACWLQHAVERAGSSFDAIPERSFVQQANEALGRSDEALMAAIAAAGQKTKVS